MRNHIKTGVLFCIGTISFKVFCIKIDDFNFDK